LFWLLGDRQNDWTKNPSQQENFVLPSSVRKLREEASRIKVPEEDGTCRSLQRRQEGIPLIFSLASGTRVFVAPVF